MGSVAGEFAGNKSGAGRFSFSKPRFNPFAAEAKDRAFGFFGGFIEGLIKKGLNEFNYV